MTTSAPNGVDHEQVEAEIIKVIKERGNADLTRILYHRDMRRRRHLVAQLRAIEDTWDLPSSLKPKTYDKTVENP